MRKNIFRAAFAVLRRGYRSEARTSLSLEKIKKESDMKKKIFFFLGILIIGLITFGLAETFTLACAFLIDLTSFSIWVKISFKGK